MKRPYTRVETRIGDKVNMLTIIKRVENNRRRTMVLTKRECGNEKIIEFSQVNVGTVRSCGCLRDETTKRVHTKHGMYKEPIYKVWDGMIGRCTRPIVHNWMRYGGRGISVCDEWRNSFSSFHAWAIVNGYKKGLVIDRVDNDGNYEPSNCRFITRKQSQRNRTVTWMITYKGETKPVMDWVEITGISYGAFRRRSNKGWDANRIFNTPENKYNIGSRNSVQERALG